MWPIKFSLTGKITLALFRANLAIFFLNESITLKQGLGIVLGMGAIILIAT